MSTDDRTTKMILGVGGERIENITSFCYTSDVLQLGDPFSVDIPDPRGRYPKALRMGATVELYLTNPDLDGGKQTPKVFGVVTDRNATGDSRGTLVHLTGADIGWHLNHNPAPVWFSLRDVTWERLALAAIHPHKVFKGKKSRKPLQPDPEWGFVGVRFENATSRGKKLGKGKIDNRRAETLAAANPAPTNKFVIQSEPGEMLSDLLLTYAKKLNVLINVSADGYLQIFRPDYSQPTRYRLEHHPAKTEQAKRNNVEQAALSEKIEGTFTEVRLYGERVYQTVKETASRPEDPNVNKFFGRWPPLHHAVPLPFAHHHIGTDGDVMGKTSAAQRARWVFQRGLFDSWIYTATVKGHGQNGVWYESDTMIDIHDSVLGVKGSFYVSAVQCSRDEKGDRTVLTMRKPKLLGVE